jgi:RecA-family ATPase
VVILLNHPSMTGKTTGTGEAGSRQWRNAVRSFVYLHNTKKDGLVLEQMGSNYSKDREKIMLSWDNGVFVVREPARQAEWGNR